MSTAIVLVLGITLAGLTRKRRACPPPAGELLNRIILQMAKFGSGLDYFAFEDDVKSRYRYVLNGKSQAFIRALTDTMHTRLITIPQATKFWRACLDHGRRTHQMDNGETDDPIIVYEEVVPCAQNRLIPFCDKAHEGRVNPKGIPCLYLSDDRRTAMMEVRPWVGSLVTVAKFATRNTMTLVDCSNDVAKPLSGGDNSIASLNDREKEELVWWTLNFGCQASTSRK